MILTDKKLVNINLQRLVFHQPTWPELVQVMTVPRVLGASPPDISPLESLLPWSVRTTLAQLRSGHCWLLNSYMARISDVCPECGVAPHSVEHLFNCQSHPTQLTVQDLWDNPATVATSSTWITDDKS